MPNEKLYGKLHAIMKDVGYIKKDKTNAFHKYKYASEEVIKKTLHTALTKHGVLFKMDVMEVFPGPTGATLMYIKVHYYFICKDSGEMIDGTYHGAGEDKGDKAIYKAITGALKYILTTSFLIPTGDDPESDIKTDKKIIKKPVVKRATKSALTDVQLNRMIAAIEKGEVKKVRERFSKYHASEAQVKKLKLAVDNAEKK